MPTQLELRSTSTRRPLAKNLLHALGSGMRGLLLWTPVWVPALFLAQILTLGLLPAREERARLDRAGAEVEQRVEALRSEQAELEREARMLSDEIYQERVRRSLVDPAAAPLSLQRARAASRP